MPANSLVRNIFHQYEREENRLTHALVHVLGSNLQLLRSFIEFAIGFKPPEGAVLSLACQRQPGDPTEVQEHQAIKRGIPDAWIYDEERGWAIAVECKITAGLSAGQIDGHFATARKRGFSNVRVLVIALDESGSGVIGQFSQAEVKWRTWPAVFEFFHFYQRMLLVPEFIDYMRVLESQLMPKIDQPLTKFVGIPFGADHPFSGTEARVVLRGLLRELRPVLAKALPTDTAANQKPLTGSWDVIQFRSEAPERGFNRYPHLSVGLGNDDAVIQLTLPNMALPAYWKRLRQLSKAELATILSEVASNIRRRHVERNVWEPQLVLDILQRHFYAQKYPVHDGHMRFDLENVLAGRGTRAGVKRVSAWLDAIYEILQRGVRTDANFELALEARFPYSTRSVSSKPEFVGELARCAKGFEPFRKMLMEDRERR